MTFTREAMKTAFVFAGAVVILVTGCTGGGLTVAQMTSSCSCNRDQACGSDGQCVRRAQQVSAGTSYACAVLSGGKLKCWGNNSDGRLGLGDTVNRWQVGSMGDELPAVDVGTGRSVLSVSAGYNAVCAILDNGQVKCWGMNPDGRLGLGDTETRGDQPGEMGDALPAIDLGTGRTALAVSPGYSHTCVILDNHQIKCFGDNAFGQLGLGDTENRGDQPGEMGDGLPTVDLGQGRTAIELAAGFETTCALLDSGQVKCWGSNIYGLLGLGDKENRGDQPGEMGDALPAIDLGPGWTAVHIASATRRTCAVRDSGRVKCWGHNQCGSLGLGDIDERGGLPGETIATVPTIELGKGRTALAISTGFLTTCALLDSHQVKCWGLNENGDLGLGDTENRGDEPGEMGDALPTIDFGSGARVSAVSSGTMASCVLLETGIVKCWGLGVTPGKDPEKYVGGLPGEMGDALPMVDLGP